MFAGFFIMFFSTISKPSINKLLRINLSILNICKIILF